MQTKHGDVLTSDAVYIGHGVNCRGVMGAGIAKTIRDKFPKNYAEYRDRCAYGKLKPGNLVAVSEGARVIVNLATQMNPGPDAQYEWVFDSMLQFSRLASERIDSFGNKIAIPQIGCGIGGLEWDKVETLVKAVEVFVPEIEYEVWIYG